MLDGEPWFNKDCKGIEIEKFLTLRSWGKNTASLKWSHGRLRQGAGRGTVAGLGHMSMLRFVGEIIWSFRSKPGLIYSNQKEQDLLSFTEVLFKNTGEGPGRQGRLLLTRAVRKFILEVYICLWQCSLSSRACTHGRG